MPDPEPARRPDPGPLAWSTEVPWRSTRHDGVFWHAFPLASGKEAESRDAVVLIRMDPGCGYPAHRHSGIEDVLVLEGGYRDERGEHRAGTHLRYEAGSRHAPVALGDRERPRGPDNPSCILFAIARDGVENLDEAPQAGDRAAADGAEPFLAR